MKKYSLFGIRFGVFIYKSTQYVSKFSVFSSITFMAISAVCIYWNLQLISEVNFCCTTTHIDLANTDLKFNKQTPEGPQTYINDPDNNIQNVTLLFPLQVYVRNLNCEDLHVNLKLVERESTNSGYSNYSKIIKMDCQSANSALDGFSVH